jgi:hypothetical protein
MSTMSTMSTDPVKSKTIEMVMTRLKLSIVEVEDLSRKLRINNARLLTIDELAGKLKLTLENQLEHVDWIWSEEVLSIGRAAYCRKNNTVLFMKESSVKDFEAYAIYVCDSRLAGCDIISA